MHRDVLEAMEIFDQLTPEQQSYVLEVMRLLLTDPDKAYQLLNPA